MRSALGEMGIGIGVDGLDDGVVCMNVFREELGETRCVLRIWGWRTRMDFSQMTDFISLGHEI